MRRNGVAFTHGEKIGDAFITFYVAFIRRLRCVYRNRKQKCNLPPLVILVVVRELFRLGLDVMEPFSCSYSLLLGKEEMVVVPMFDRVRKDWFDVCLCLWIVKTIVLPESGHDPLARRSFSILRIFMSAVSPDVRYFNVVL